MGNKVISRVGPKLGIYEESNDAQLSASLGQVREMEDGRKFRLCFVWWYSNCWNTVTICCTKRI